MPGLEVLKLGKAPWGAPISVTVHGIITLATHCLHLSELRVRIRAYVFVDAVTGPAKISHSADRQIVQQEDCSLTDLEVGDIPIPARWVVRVALVLLHIFPRVLDIKYKNPGWKCVTETIKDFRRVGDFVRHAGSVHVQAPWSPLTDHQESQIDTANGLILLD